MLKVRELLNFLQQQDPEATVKSVFSLDTHAHIRRQILNSIQKGSSRSEKAIKLALNRVKKPDKSLDKLLPTWKENPSTFFREWELGQGYVESEMNDVGDIGRRFLHTINQTRRISGNKILGSIRLIFNCLLFRDILFLIYTPQQASSLLPRGTVYLSLIKQAYKILTRGDLDINTTREISEWAKRGQCYHRISNKLGIGYLLLASDFVVEWQPSANDILLQEELKPLKTAVNKEVEESGANSIGEQIRETQLNPYREQIEFGKLPNTSGTSKLGASKKRCAKQQNVPPAFNDGTYRTGENMESQEHILSTTYSRAPQPQYCVANNLIRNQAHGQSTLPFLYNTAHLAPTNIRSDGIDQQISSMQADNNLLLQSQMTSQGYNQAAQNTDNDLEYLEHTNQPQYPGIYSLPYSEHANESFLNDKTSYVYWNDIIFPSNDLSALPTHNM